MQVSSIDYVNRLIHLHPDTVISGFNIVEAYTEIRALRTVTQAHRRFSPLLQIEGGFPKGNGELTYQYGSVADNVRLVPYNVTHRLDLWAEIVCIPDALKDSALFNLAPLSDGVSVHITKQYSDVNIRTVSSGSGLDTAQAAQLASVLSNVLAVRASLEPLEVGGQLASVGSPY